MRCCEKYLSAIKSSGKPPGRSIGQPDCREGVLAFLVLMLAGLGTIPPLYAQPPTAEAVGQQNSNAKIRVLLIDGQNNHGNWPQTSQMMRTYLTESGKFEVDIARTKPRGVDAEFHPDFSKYQVVLSNYNGASWPKATRQAFVDYMKQGGGLVIIHAADNAFADWPEYNRMIGLGGWGGRDQNSGPYVYYDESGQRVVDPQAGRGGSHGRQHEFQIIVRDDQHPITRQMPTAWMHANDELYDRLRGPASNMNILATAFSSPSTGGSGRHEPMVMTVNYGKGRVFHTTLGHGNDSQMCVGFVTLLLRGCEWAATGEVSIEIPKDFPSTDSTSSREFNFTK